MIMYENEKFETAKVLMGQITEVITNSKYDV